MIGQVFFTSLFGGIIIAVGFILLVIPGIIMAVNYSLALVVSVVEGKRGMAALQQSKAYVKGHWFEVFWRYLALAVLVGVLNGILALILNKEIMSVVSLLLSLVYAPLYALMSYQVYRELKAAKEHTVPTTTA